jgi:hypothetical protein
MEVLDRNPVLKKRLFKSMKALGIDPGRYIVGNDLNSLNPVTGQPEFFFKKIFKRIKKAAGDISGYAAPIVGAMYGPAAGALVGAGLGAFKRENPGDPSQWAQMGMRGGLSGVASNLATGQGWLGGKGLRGAYGLDTYNPVKIGKAMMGQDVEGASGKGWEHAFKTGTGEDSKWKFMEELGFEGTKKVKDISDKKKEGFFGDMSLGQIAKLYGLGTAGLGLLIQMTTDDEDVGTKVDPYEPHGKVYESILNPQLQYAKGGVMDLQGGGESRGPGTGTSDSIPAMLSDGEFVMTADAVRGAGGGDRREGARRMYEAMDRLEARA